MISIHHGGQFSHRVNVIQDELLQLNDSNLISNRLVLLPSKRWKNRFVEDLIERSEQKAVALPHVYSYAEFLDFIQKKLTFLEQAAKPKLYLTEFLKEKLFQELLNSLKGKFQYYQILNEEEATKGVAKRLLMQIDELISAGYSAEAFLEKSKKLKNPRSFDIYLIFKQYEDQILNEYTNQNYLHIDLLKYLSKEQFLELLPSISCIYCLSFDIFSHLMSAFLLHLSQFVRDFEIHLNGDLQDESLMPHTKSDLNFLLNNAAEINFYPFEKDEFNYKKEQVKKDIHLASFSSFEEEIRQIFSLVAEKEEEGISLHEMLLVFPDVDELRQNLRDLGEEFTIPLNISSGFRLAEAAVIQFIRSIFNLSLKNFPYIDLLRFFESPYHEFKISPKLRKHLAANIGNFSIDPLFEIDEDTSDLKRLKKILEENFKEIKTAKSYVDALYKSLEDMNFFHYLAAENVPYQEIDIEIYEPDIRAFYRFSELLKILQLSYDLSSKNKFDRIEFTNALVQEIQEHDFQIQEIRNTKLTVLPLLELRAEKAKVIFLAGMNQSKFPKIKIQKSLFNDEDREELRLTRNRFPVEEERYLLYLALNRKKSEIYISDHSKGSEKDRQSILIRELDAHCNFLEWSYKKELISSRLEAKFKRNNSQISSNYYDFFATGKLGRKIEAQFKEQSFSASQLQRYVDCPYRFFLHDLLKIRKLDEAEDGLTATEAGSFIHRIMFRLFTEHENLMEKATAVKYELIQKLVEEELEAYKEKDSYFIDRFEIVLEQDRFKAIIDEDESLFSDYKAQYFEWRFGRKTNDDLEDPSSTDEFLKIPHSEGSLKLSGKVDRIDLNEQNEALLIDYKSSDRIRTTEVNNYQSLQIPLYILAVNELIASIDGVAGLIFIVGKKKNIKKKVVFADKAAGFKNDATRQKDFEGNSISFDDFLSKFKEKLGLIHQEILHGNYPLEPMDKSKSLNNCRYCDYKFTCRIREKIEYEEG